MAITKLADISTGHTLFNSVCEGETVYKKLSLEQFTEQFFNDTDTVTKINLVATQDNKAVAYANGCYNKENGKGYITFVVVDKPNRRKGIGRELLLSLEKELTTLCDKPPFKAEIIFFNPIALTWCVPDTARHDHPNSPGVDVSSGVYLFLKNCGYRDTVYQNSFYQPLDKFFLSDDIKTRLAKLSDNDLSICFYDEAKHFGLNELFTNLENEPWREIIMGNVNGENPKPVLIAECKGEVVGFTGPLYVQESGRGYFAGIGVHSEFRKYGLGKSLFYSLCNELKNMGAMFMTLFTGETNPARNIYESAGFRIVRTWADMEKILLKE